MKKFKEVPRKGFTTKWYFREENKTILDIIRDLKNNSEIKINYIHVDEDVELDAKEVAGSYNVDTFIANYDKYKTTGTGLTYKVVMTYNDLNVLIDLHEGSNLVVLSTPEPSLEIEDLIQKKSNTINNTLGV